jgi:prepilin-type processing-associated H-X9-DG protein
MDQDSLWHISAQACLVDRFTYHNPPHIGYATVIPSYICPADGRLDLPLKTPSGDFAAFGSYLGVGGAYTSTGLLSGVFTDSPGIRLTDIRDGTSNTLMVGERPPPDSLQAGRWYSGRYVLERFGGPDIVLAVNQSKTFVQDLECANAQSTYGFGRTDNPCDRFHFWSLHPGGSNFLFADGSARLIAYTNAQILGALASRSGGEVVDLSD